MKRHLPEGYCGRRSQGSRTAVGPAGSAVRSRSGPSHRPSGRPGYTSGVFCSAAATSNRFNTSLQDLSVGLI